MLLTRDSKYIKQKLTEGKGQGNILTIILGDFNSPLSIMKRTKQKIKTYKT